MRDAEEELLEAFRNLLKIRNECSCSVSSECGVSDMTVKQIAYLRIIDHENGISFSRLAELTQTSKPTVTEMINKCARLECVYREPCPEDGRVQYIRLTEKGRAIARAEDAALRRMIERMARSLDERELDLLIEVLEKIR